MMYAEIAEKVLKDKDPQEYLRLKSRRELQPFLQHLEEEYRQKQGDQMSVVLQAAPHRPWSKREQAIEMGRMQIQEVLIAQLVEQLSVSASGQPES
jgi:hypothetical protein